MSDRDDEDEDDNRDDEREDNPNEVPPFDGFYDWNLRPATAEELARTRSLMAQAAARSALLRAQEPAIPMGLQSRPCLPGQGDTLRAKFDGSVSVFDFDVARSCSYEWMILAIRADERPLLGDVGGVPADVFHPDALGMQGMPPETCTVFEVDVLRLQLDAPDAWQRLCGATHLDRAASALAKLGLHRLAGIVQRFQGYRYRQSPAPETFRACVWHVRNRRPCL